MALHQQLRPEDVSLERAVAPDKQIFSCIKAKKSWIKNLVPRESVGYFEVEGGDFYGTG
jgi:hypothetical protein